MNAHGGEGFPKAARVCRRREYLALGRTGQRRHAPHFVILMEPRAGSSRLGITVSRKVGIAVVRNLVKRRIREVFRRDPNRLVPGHDLVVIAKPGAGALDVGELRREITQALTTVRDPPAGRV